MSGSPTQDAEKVAALREVLPATGAGIYLDTASAGPLPAETAAAMHQADEWELRVGRATAGRDDDVAQRAEEARAVLAALVGAPDPSRIVLTAGLRAALGAAVSAISWRRGDRLLTTAIDEPLVRPLVGALARSLGVEIEVAAPSNAESTSVGLADALDARLGRSTRLVFVSHVAADDGLLLPVAEISRRAHAHDAAVLVDATRAAGAVAVDITQLGADFVALRADAWLLAPEGTAALWDGLSSDDTGRTLAAPDGLSRTALLGLARSVGWLEMYVGLPWALDRGQRLARRLATDLGRLDGVELLTPTDAMATIVTFRLPAWPAEDAADELGRRVFSLLRPLPAERALRASVAWFNTEEELARFAGAVAELGRHTPDTLPRRPTLTVL